MDKSTENDMIVYLDLPDACMVWQHAAASRGPSVRLDGRAGMCLQTSTMGVACRNACGMNTGAGLKCPGFGVGRQRTRVLHTEIVGKVCRYQCDPVMIIYRGA